MKVVLDTNILVSGLLTPYGPCAEIMRMVSSGELTLCVDARVLTEYREVLCRPKFSFDEDHVFTLLYYVEYTSQTVAASPLRLPLSDPDDEAFLEITLSGGAEYLVTGNASHCPEAMRDGAIVITPGDFMRAYRDRSSSSSI